MYRKMKLGLSIFLSLALFISVGCASPKVAEKSTLQIVDQLGRTVEITKIPQRIISLAPSNTEILYALGLGDKVVGVTSYDDYPPEVKQKPVIGGFTTPDIEKIVAQAPDLILATGLQEKDIIPELEQRGLTVVGIDPSSIDGIYQAITLVGEITGQKKQASSVISSMQASIKKITDVTDKLTASQKPRTLYLTWSDPLYTVGSGNLDDEIISLAGGTNITHNLQGTTTVTLEQVLQDNPQVIIAGTGMGTGGDATLQFAQTDPRLSVTDARRHNQIYSVDMDVAGRAGPRIADVLQEFAQCIHPELFGAPPSPNGN